MRDNQKAINRFDSNILSAYIREDVKIMKFFKSKEGENATNRPLIKEIYYCFLKQIYLLHAYYND
jgi:hypothetical protein